MRKIRIIKTKFLMIAMLFLCVIFAYASCLGVSTTIFANAQTVINIDSTIKADFNESVDVSNVFANSWDMNKDDFSRVSTSKITEFESFAKKHAKNKYDLVYVINVSFFENGQIEYLEQVNGLQRINFRLNFSGSKVVDGYCAVVYLETHKTQNELMTTYKENIDLLSNATTESLTYLSCNVSAIEGESGINLSVNTTKPGVYLIFQIDTTYFNAQNLFLVIGIGIILAIIVLLVIITIRVVKAKNLSKVQERIRTSGDSFLSGKKRDMELDKDEIQKNNLTRKVPQRSVKATKSINNVKQVPQIPNLNNKQNIKVAPKLPTKLQINKINNGEE